MVTNKQAKPRITLSKPEDLLAAVPSLLGFRPADSVVLLARSSSGKKIEKCVRADLPPPEHAEQLAHQLIDAVAATRPSAVLIAIIGDGPEDDGPLPHQELTTALRDELSGRGVGLLEALWVAELTGGRPWRCYGEPEHRGILPDPKCSIVAAELAALGHVTYGSRVELERLLAPDDELLLRRRAELIDQLRAAGEMSTERAAEAVRAGLRAAGSGLLALSDDQLAELAIALTDTTVRDACLATALPPESPLAAAAARLWQALTRHLPAPERADAACLAGYAAYQQGDGALAGMALRAAIAADSTHICAGLLMRALEMGMHPEQLQQLGQHDEIGLCAQLRAAA